MKDNNDFDQKSTCYTEKNVDKIALKILNVQAPIFDEYMAKIQKSLLSAKFFLDASAWRYVNGKDALAYKSKGNTMLTLDKFDSKLLFLQVAKQYGRSYGLFVEIPHDPHNFLEFEQSDGGIDDGANKANVPKIEYREPGEPLIIRKQIKAEYQDKPIIIDDDTCEIIMEPKTKPLIQQQALKARVTTKDGINKYLPNAKYVNTLEGEDKAINTINKYLSSQQKIRSKGQGQSRNRSSHHGSIQKMRNEGQSQRSKIIKVIPRKLTRIQENRQNKEMREKDKATRKRYNIDKELGIQYFIQEEESMHAGLSNDLKRKITTLKREDIDEAKFGNEEETKWRIKEKSEKLSTYLSSNGEMCTFSKMPYYKIKEKQKQMQQFQEKFRADKTQASAMEYNDEAIQVLHQHLNANTKQTAEDGEEIDYEYQMIKAQEAIRLSLSKAQQVKQKRDEGMAKLKNLQLSGQIRRQKGRLIDSIKELQFLFFQEEDLMDMDALAYAGLIDESFYGETSVHCPSLFKRKEHVYPESTRTQIIKSKERIFYNFSQENIDVLAKQNKLNNERHDDITVNECHVNDNDVLEVEDNIEFDEHNQAVDVQKDIKKPKLSVLSQTLKQLKKIKKIKIKQQQQVHDILDIDEIENLPENSGKNIKLQQSIQAEPEIVDQCVQQQAAQKGIQVQEIKPQAELNDSIKTQKSMKEHKKHHKKPPKKKHSIQKKDESNFDVLDYEVLIEQAAQMGFTVYKSQVLNEVIPSIIPPPELCVQLIDDSQVQVQDQKQNLKIKLTHNGKAKKKNAESEFEENMHQEIELGEIMETFINRGGNMEINNLNLNPDAESVFIQDSLVKLDQYEDSIIAKEGQNQTKQKKGQSNRKNKNKKIKTSQRKLQKID